MIEINGGFETAGFYLYPDPDTLVDRIVYRYFPLEPQPELDPQDHPTLLFLPVGSTGLLQMGVTLAAADPKVAALRTKLANHLSVNDLGHIELQPAPLTVQQAVLQIGHGLDDTEPSSWVDLASNPTSGIYPFNALFNMTIDSLQQAAVTACLNGRQGFLRIVYHASLPVNVTISARIYGDLRPMILELNQCHHQATAEHIRAEAAQQIDRALQQGLLRQETDQPESTPIELTAQVKEESRQRMIDFLFKTAIENEPLAEQTHAEASVKRSARVDIPFILLTDIATWFDGTGLDHVILPPGN